MSLAIGFVCEKFAILVADRMLTHVAADGTTTTVDEQANKVVVYANRMAFAYAGMACINTTSSDLWLAEKLKEAKADSVWNAVQYVASCLNREFPQVGLPSSHQRKHAYLSVGYLEHSAGELPTPIVSIISNFHRHGDVNPSPIASEYFTAQVWSCSKVHHVVQSVGVNLNDNETKRMHRNITRIVERKQDSHRITQVLMETVRQASNRLRNKWVGKSVLAIAFPVPISDKGDVWILGPNGFNYGSLSYQGDSDGFGVAFPVDWMQSMVYESGTVVPQACGPVAVNSKGYIAGVKSIPPKPEFIKHLQRTGSKPPIIHAIAFGIDQV